MSVSRLLARPLLASAFIVTGANALRNASAIAPQAQPVTDKIAPLAEKAVHQAAPNAPVPQDPTTWVRIIGGVQVLAGAALAFARAVGEFGSVVLISGNKPFDTQVASVYVFKQIESDNATGAAAVSVVLLAVSLVVLIALRALERRGGA